MSLFFAEDEADYAFAFDRVSDDGKQTPLGGVILEGSMMESIEEIPRKKEAAA